MRNTVRLKAFRPYHNLLFKVVHLERIVDTRYSPRIDAYVDKALGQYAEICSPAASSHLRFHVSIQSYIELHEFAHQEGQISVMQGSAFFSSIFLFFVNTFLYEAIL